ncbi:hypothetical protein TSOC_000775 [Tetrabaena socialis]|uniref:Guanylate cyclase domain-containing protein n=1 Tax=Tetrabaena socialis TaxID=47790 RepID=A0A2J8AIF3_9CHLO|nr:hypothetical protein TSOC_000775 [Tetrabaena socialis]|eukprot:PNH12300.1 hypothetical protein TSOC_000775 [Tetrabaena socialis]
MGARPGLPLACLLAFFSVVAPPLAAQTQSSLDVLAVSASCAHANLPNVIKSCYPSKIRPGNVSNNARLASAALLQACIQEAPQDASTTPRPLRIVGPELDLFRALSVISETTFSRITGVPINFTLLPQAVYSSQRQSLLLDPLPPTADRGYDALLATPSAFGDAAQVYGKLLDLSYLVAGDKLLDWGGIQAQFKSVVTYDGAVVAIPLIPAPQLLYYHKGIFERDNLSVPQTWDEFADLAERYHGREGMLGACVQPAGCRSESFVLRMIFGSYVLTRGQSQGLFWDAESLDPLVKSPAMEAALKMFRRLRAVGPNVTGSCLRPEYIQGKCLLSVNGGNEFKAGQLGKGTTAMRGRMGMALMPGSAQVLDRRTMTLQPCTPELCPLWSGTSIVNGVALPVNRPIMPVTSLVLINGLAPPAFQFYVYNLFSWLASPGVTGTAGLLTSSTELLPVREQDMADSNVPAWVAAGYVEEDTRSFLGVYRAMANSVNVNADLKIRLTTNVTNMLLASALLYNNVSLNADVGEVMARMEAVLNAIVAAEGGKEAFARMYRRSINWSPSASSVSSPPPPPPEGKVDAGRGRLLGLAVAIPCGAAVVLVLGLLVLLRVVLRRRQRGGSSAAAPGVGSSTTLCITDIQDSTVLWECVAAEHMDAALKIHHRVIREALLAHKGYESGGPLHSPPALHLHNACLRRCATFFHPLGALLFAVEAQQALLDAPWPLELLQHAPLPDIQPLDDPAWELVCSNRPPQRLPKNLSLAVLKSPASSKAAAAGPAAASFSHHLTAVRQNADAEAATQETSSYWDAPADTHRQLPQPFDPSSRPSTPLPAAISGALATPIRLHLRTPSFAEQGCSFTDLDSLPLPTVELLATLASPDGGYSSPTGHQGRRGGSGGGAAAAPVRPDAPAPGPHSGALGGAAASAARPIAAAGARSARRGAAPAFASAAAAAADGLDLAASAGGLSRSPVGSLLRPLAGTGGRPASVSRLAQPASASRSASQQDAGGLHDDGRIVEIGSGERRTLPQSGAARLAACQPAAALHRGSQGPAPAPLAGPGPRVHERGPASLPSPGTRGVAPLSLDSSGRGGGAGGGASAPFAGPVAQAALGSLGRVPSGLSADYGNRSARASNDGTPHAASSPLRCVSGVGVTLARALAAQYGLVGVPGPLPPSAVAAAAAAVAAGGAGGSGTGGAGAAAVRKAEARCVAFRGLRVRMGLSSGVNSGADVCRNAASGRIAYSGYPLRLAKAVTDAAHGGMVLLSEATREQLLADEAAGRALQHVLVLWMGRHALGCNLRDMPSELLQHPLCEEVAFDGAVVVGSLQSSADMVRHRLQSRDDVRTQQGPVRRTPGDAAAGGWDAAGGGGGVESVPEVEGAGAPEAEEGEADAAQAAGAGPASARAGEAPAGAPPSADVGRGRSEYTWRAPSAPRDGILFRGLRARGALVYGDLGGELTAGFGPSAGQVAYRSKAWSALGRLGAKSKAGEVATNAATASLLAPQFVKLVVVRNV